MPLPGRWFLQHSGNLPHRLTGRSAELQFIHASEWVFGDHIFSFLFHEKNQKMYRFNDNLG